MIAGLGLEDLLSDHVTLSADEMSLISQQIELRMQQTQVQVNNASQLQRPSWHREASTSVAVCFDLERSIVRRNDMQLADGGTPVVQPPTELKRTEAAPATASLPYAGVVAVSYGHAYQYIRLPISVLQ